MLRHITVDQLSPFTRPFLALYRPTHVRFPSILQTHKSEIPHNATSRGVMSDRQKIRYLLCPRHGTRIYRVIQNVCRGKIVQWQFHTKFGKQPPSDNSIRRWYGQFQETGCVCVPELKARIYRVCGYRGDWRYESEPPLKPPQLTCYRQFGTNWIIVLMFVESQRVYK